MIRHVTERFSVSPQIGPEQIDAAAADGVTTIICNRPDGEDPGQPDVAAIAAYAGGRGMDVVHIAVGPAGISREMIDRTNAVLDAAEGSVLAYCRSGTRSINLWALAQAARGADAEGLVAAGSAAGYDLRGLVPTLRHLAGQ